MLKISQSHDGFIFNMAIPIPGKGGLYIETGPWYLHSRYAGQEQHWRPRQGLPGKICLMWNQTPSTGHMCSHTCTLGDVSHPFPTQHSLRLIWVEMSDAGNTYPLESLIRHLVLARKPYDMWVSSWIIFPVWSTNTMESKEISQWTVHSSQLQTNTGGICWSTCYLPQIRWGISQTVLYRSAPVGLKATNQGGPQIGADAICNALAVTKPDKQIPQSSHACRFEGW